MKLPKHFKPGAVYGTIPIAAVLWFVMFVLRPYNFWLMMACSTGLLGAFAFALNPCLVQRNEFNVRNIAIGAASAVLLYGIFWLGNQALAWLPRYLPFPVMDRGANLAAIYASRDTLPPLAIVLLLLFPIGSCEELYWRGLIQNHFARRIGPAAGYAAATLIYIGVHVPTGNPMLVIAAGVCGLFWGGLYWRTRSIVPGLVSHMLWDPLIFVLFPLK